MSQQKWKEDYIKVQEYLKGNTESWDMLYNEAYPIVYNYVNRISIKDYVGNSMIDDIVSESFERCYNKLEVFKGRSKFSTWVCAFSRYVLLSQYSKEKTRNILNNKLKYISSIVSEIESPELIVIKKEQYRCLNTAFKALSSKHKLLIKCYILKIIPPNTVIKYTHLKYSDRMIELQIAINVLRRYYLFLYEKG